MTSSQYLPHSVREDTFIFDAATGNHVLTPQSPISIDC